VVVYWAALTLKLRKGSFMETSVLQKQFERMGARLKVSVRSTVRRTRFTGFAVDIGRDGRGPFFDVTLGKDAERELEVLDVQPGQRHLLLLVREPNGHREEKHKFLCGHDERDWFAAAVPETSGVATVRTAMEALKPVEVLAAQAKKGLKTRQRNRRHNKAFIRQGEWFFIPEPDLFVNPELVLTHEPLARGRGKPHWAEFLYRKGGVNVYVCSEHPQGISEQTYRQVIAENPAKKRLGWRLMQRDASVYVCGRVRHPDHKTVKLNGWHKVVPNTESQAASMRHLAFLD
jgi:hypothetical protein